MKKRGKTLTGILVAICVIGILAAILVPHFIGQSLKKSVMADIQDPETNEVRMARSGLGDQDVTIRKGSGPDEATITYNLSNFSLKPSDLESLGFVPRGTDEQGRYVWMKEPPKPLPEE